VNKPAVSIRQLFRTHGRFLRSTNLERDFNDPRALDSYFLTPFVTDAFERIVAGAASGSGRRAWRITGDYGVGKSSFALLLARHLADPESAATSGLLRKAGVKKNKAGGFVAVLITGDREGLVGSIARGIARAFASDGRGRASQTIAALIAAADKAAKHGTTSSLNSLLDQAAAAADKKGKGILLVLDEMGKFLEHAANHPEAEDVFVLQALAERAVRSDESPFMIVGLLHQGFHAYAERLPFAQMVAESKRLVRVARGAGWLGRVPVEEMSELYPLHPMVLPVLVRFFARFGQHERSLFGFLLSNEPFGLQTFSDVPVAKDTWYRLHDFFDYVRAVFGHRLSGESYRSSWLRLIEIVDRAHELSGDQLAVVKTAAILNLLDSEDLAATEAAIAAALGWADRRTTDALGELVARGTLFRRGQGGVYRLWGSSSVNLRAAFEEAITNIGDPDDLAKAIVPYLDERPIAARRHYLTTGTLRYFDVRYVNAASVESAAATAPNADGSLVVALVRTEGERAIANIAARRSKRRDVVVVVSDVLSALSADLKDAEAWRYVIANTAELTEDPFSLAEAERQFKQCAAKVAEGLEEATGLRSSLSRSCSVNRA
jgi:hypothetical protein